MKSMAKYLMLSLVAASYLGALDSTKTIVEPASFLAQNDIVAGKTPVVFLTNVKSKNYLEVHDPRKDKNSIASIDENFEVTSDSWWLYNTNKKSKQFHKMETKLGQAVATVLETLHLKNVTSYNGEAIADEYNHGFPMYWFFENVCEFRKVREYLESYISIRTEINRPLLILEIEDDKNLDSLNQEDRRFLDRYFVMPQGNDALVLLDFFAESKKYLRETTSRVEGSSPTLSLGKDLRDYAFYDLQKFCKEFKAEKYLPEIMKALFYGYVLKTLWNNAGNKADQNAKAFGEKVVTGAETAITNIKSTDAKALIKALLPFMSKSEAQEVAEEIVETAN